MINLLPLKERQKLFSEKKKKLIKTLGIVVLISLICLVLVFSLIRIYILTELSFQKDMSEQNSKETQSSDFKNLSDIVKKYNAVLVWLDSFFKKEIYFSQALETISGVPSPADLYFTNFSLSRNENGNVQVAISGISATRDGLLVFKKNIEENEKIKNSSFSPGSWVDPKNAKFSLTFEISKDEK